MARLRFVKSPEQLKAQAEAGTPKLESTVRSIRIVYETDPNLYRAVIPQPLEPIARPEMHVTLSHVAMHITPEFTFEIGSAAFGAAVTYNGQEGTYLIAMPMTAEAAVVGGRERYGEPKKIADIVFEQEGDRAHCSVTRMGIPYIEAEGRLGESLGPREFDEHAFCIKAFPSPDEGTPFDDAPRLVRLDWHQTHRKVHAFDGTLELRESPFDPVADLPVKRIVRMEYEEGSTESSGTMLRSLDPEWVMPILHGRNDEPGFPGIEVATEDA
jgi:acetoacetate decarboxylase